MDTLKATLLALLITILLSACGSSKHSKTVDTKAKTESAPQVFIDKVADAGPGECFTKVQTSTGKQFLRTLCPNQLTPELKQEIKNRLIELGYSIGKEEMESPELGADSLAELIKFQNKAGLHSGIIDPSTMDAMGIINY